MCPRCYVFDSFLAELTLQQAMTALSQAYRLMGLGQGLILYQCTWWVGTVGEEGITTQSWTQTEPMRGNNGLGVKSICEVGPVLAGAQSNMPLCWRGTAMGAGTDWHWVGVGGFTAHHALMMLENRVAAYMRSICLFFPAPWCRFMTWRGWSDQL